MRLDIPATIFRSITYVLMFTLIHITLTVIAMVPFEDVVGSTLLPWTQILSFGILSRGVDLLDLPHPWLIGPSRKRRQSKSNVDGVSQQS